MPATPIPKIKDYFIFDLPAAAGSPLEQVGIKFANGTAVKTNGPNSFVCYAGGGGQGVVVVYIGTLADFLNQL